MILVCTMEGLLTIRRTRWSCPHHTVAPFALAFAFLTLFLHVLYHAPPEALQRLGRGGAGEDRAVCARRQWCCGHRGARTVAPENTMAAFLTALKVGANCIEMDVHRTSDGEVAVVHATHFRSKIVPANAHTSNSNLVRIEDTPWDSLQTLDAGSWFGEQFRNERIPLLETVLEAFWDVDVRLIVELKAEQCVNSTQEWEQRYAESLKASLLRIHHADGRSPRCSLLFTSFNHSLVDALSQVTPLAPTLPSGLGYILDPHSTYTGAKFRDPLAWLAPHVSKAAEVERLWGRRRCVSSWVTDSRESIEHQFRLGVQAVTTNLPALCPTISLDS